MIRIETLSKGPGTTAGGPGFTSPPTFLCQRHKDRNAPQVNPTWSTPEVEYSGRHAAR
jgi:hypothetical protein